MGKSNSINQIAVLLVALLIIAIIIHFSSQSASAAPDLNKEFGIVELSVSNATGTSTFYAYLASTVQQQEQGYMNQSSTGNCNGMEPCFGMVFDFSNYSYECFWMKNTEIPLKQVWVSENDTVTYVYNAAPYSLTPICSFGVLVLESSPNSIIAQGDKVSISSV